MRKGFLGSTLVLVALAFSAVLLAQSGKPSGAASNMPNLSGTWNRGIGRTAAGVFEYDPGGVPFLGFTKQDPSLQPSTLDIYQNNPKGSTDPQINRIHSLHPTNSVFP